MSRFFFRKRQTLRTPSRRWELDATSFAEYHNALQSQSPTLVAIDDRTWSDLELDKTFLRLDRSLTPCGSQYLYRQLRSYSWTEKPGEKTAQSIQTLIDNRAIASKLAWALDGLNYREAAELPGFLFRDGDAIQRFYQVFYALSILTIVMTVGVFLNHALFLPLVGLWIINMVISLRLGPHFASDASALSALSRLLVSVQKLQKLEKSHLPELATLEDLSKISDTIQKKIRWSSLRPVNPNDLLDAGFEYLNMLCLFEITCSFRIAVAIRDKREVLRRIFDLVARLDALRGLAISLPEYPSWCHAQLHDGHSFSFEKVYHPLIVNAVPNSIEADKSLLVSGTNMAGKTTFIKSLALNIILAQSLGVCLARKACVPRMKVRTLIKRDDTVTLNKSYFFGEAKELLSILRESEKTAQPCLIVIDEIFRGTNSVERIAAGKAVLRHLTSKMFVIATTHDIELSTLLRNEFSSCHFAEEVTDDGIQFTYVLKHGPCTSRNAIRLLAMAGYPQAVIDEAEAGVDQTLSHHPGLPISFSQSPKINSTESQHATLECYGLLR